MLAENCVDPNPHAADVAVASDHRMSLLGKLDTQAGYSFNLCYKCESGGGANFHTRVLKFTQRKDCATVLTALTNAFTVTKEYRLPSA